MSHVRKTEINLDIDDNTLRFSSIKHLGVYFLIMIVSFLYVVIRGHCDINNPPLQTVCMQSSCVQLSGVTRVQLRFKRDTKLDKNKQTKNVSTNDH